MNIGDRSILYLSFIDTLFHLKAIVSHKISLSPSFSSQISMNSTSPIEDYPNNLQVKETHFFQTMNVFEERSVSKMVPMLSFELITTLNGISFIERTKTPENQPASYLSRLQISQRSSKYSHSWKTAPLSEGFEQTSGKQLSRLRINSNGLPGPLVRPRSLSSRSCGFRKNHGHRLWLHSPRYDRNSRILVHDPCSEHPRYNHRDHLRRVRRCDLRDPPRRLCSENPRWYLKKKEIHKKY